MSKTQIDKIVLIDYKGHEKYSADLNGRCAILVGRNGVGKTSVIEAIKRLLGMEIKKPGFPIKTGSDKAVITVHLNANGTEYICEEKYTKADAKGRLKFYRVKDGYKDELTPALDRLKDIVGNPLDLSELIDMDGKTQFNFFIKQVKSLADISRFEHDYENLYSDRTMVNQQVKRAAARLDSPELRVVSADINEFTTEKSAEELYKKKKDASKLQAEKNKAVAHNTQVDSAERELVNLDKQIADLQKQIDALNKRVNSGKAWVQNNPRISTDAIDAEINDIDEYNSDLDREIASVSSHNAQVIKARNYVAAQKELDEEKKKSDELTKKMKAAKDKIFNAIKEIPFSTLVPGLELKYIMDEETGKAKEMGLHLDGLPFHRSQQSYGKMLKTLAILAGYFNPDKLNFISIGDYSLLDKTNQQEIWDFVKENPDLHLQVIAEKVDENKEIATEIIEL